MLCELVLNYILVGCPCLEIDEVQPRSVTEIAPESVLLSVNRNPIQYCFRAGAKARAKMMGFVNKVFERHARKEQGLSQQSLCSLGSILLMKEK